MDIELTREQVQICLAAEKEDYYKGHTDKRCPICGGRLMIERSGNSCTVKCEKDGCIKMTCRGI